MERGSKVGKLREGNTAKEAVVSSRLSSFWTHQYEHTLI